MSAKPTAGAPAPTGVRARAAAPKSDAMARQMAKAKEAADALKPAGRTGGWATKAGSASPRMAVAGQAKVAGQVKPVMKKPAGITKPKPKVAPGGPTPEEIAKRNRDAQFRALVDPAAQEERKRQHLEAFKKLQAMSMDDLQVEFIVCIRAEHYKDALMYSEIMLEKDPKNSLVAQFQPLLASMAVQANERLCESSDSDSDDTDGEGGDDDDGEGEGAEGEAQGVEEEESDSDSDDPETAWMWSETWRTDPDEDELPAPAPQAEKA
jgi:hypothetical protein